MYVLLDEAAEAGVRVEAMDANEVCEALLSVAGRDEPPNRDEPAAGVAGVEGCAMVKCRSLSAPAHGSKRLGLPGRPCGRIGEHLKSRWVGLNAFRVVSFRERRLVEHCRFTCWRSAIVLCRRAVHGKDPTVERRGRSARIAMADESIAEKRPNLLAEPASDSVQQLSGR